MDKMNNKLKEDILILKNILDDNLNIINPYPIEFKRFVNSINKLETHALFLDKLEYIEVYSALKRLFWSIERNKNTFFEHKYLIYTTFTLLITLYQNELEGLSLDEKLSISIFENMRKIEEIVNEKNRNKAYYYIKIKLNNKLPYFYLTRKLIILNLLQEGKPYNYTPSILDDDRYPYLILDYMSNKDFDPEHILRKLKEEDEAILNYDILKVDMKDNIYNLRFFVSKNANDEKCLILDNFNFLDRIHYQNYYDSYIKFKNQKFLLKELFKIQAEELNVISIKKFIEDEVKIYLPNGLNEKNVKEVFDDIRKIMIDKNITEIIYNKKLDFMGYQVLEYLNKRYNIEYVKVNR